jgi:hypothetical protein
MITSLAGDDLKIEVFMGKCYDMGQKKAIQTGFDLLMGKKYSLIKKPVL